MAPIVYPLPYVETTFRTREQTEGLLRPELENGTISHHDFAAACDFYPDPIRRRMPVRTICPTLCTTTFRSELVRLTCR